MQSIESILGAIERLPAAKLEVDNSHVSAGVRVGTRIVARIDLRHGGVVVDLPADRIPTLQRVFPSSRSTADGIAFDLADAQSCAEALAAIRRRVNVEGFVWQSWAASP